MAEPAVAKATREPPRPARPALQVIPPAGAARAGIPPPVGRLPLPGAPGSRLSPAVAGPLTRSLGVDVSGVRVHDDTSAAATAGALGARAFTVGRDVFLGGGERPTDLPLMAHEVAHVVQQESAPALQRWTPGSGDSHEAEANRASAAVVRNESFTVRERTAPRMQRLGISDALDYFADKANYIPGFRMFTIILGVNPINMSRVDRSPANILRAVIEFIPGGALITQALDNHGVFDKVGAWVDEQIKTLGMTGSLIKDAISKFLDSLGWRDIFHLGDVWDRAKRIFTEPIDRILSFLRGLVDGIIKFIKDAILMPLAKLAEGTRGWPLLTAVLGKNPITDEPVPRNAETLIGGFMHLIGQDEVWENMKKANAVSRAWAWFQTAIEELLGFVRQIPTLAINAFKSLELFDIVLVPRAFIKVGAVFAGFLLDFISWAGEKVWKLLEIIFDVVSPGAWGYIKKTGAALRSILRNPFPFMGNLVKAAKLGFQKFASNFLEHLKAGLLNWLTGSLPGIYIPKAFEIKEIIKFVLSVLGLTWANLRAKLVREIGETAVKVLETTFDIVITLVRDGPAAAWEKIKEQLTNLKDMIISGITDMVVDAIVTKAVPKLIAMFIPGAGFISAIITIYDTIMVFVQKIRTIIQVVKSFVDGIVAIAEGRVEPAAQRVESTLAGLLSLAISFLAGFAGLGNVATKVMGVVEKIRAPFDKGMEAVAKWVGTMARAAGRAIVGAARSAAGSVVGWLGLRKQFSVNAESHSLSFAQGAPSPTLVLATAPIHVGSWINQRRTELRANNQFDGPREAAYTAIQDDLRALGRQTYSPGATASTAEQERTVRQLLDRIAANIAVLGVSGSVAPVPRMVVTPGFSSGKAGNMTVQFLFNDPNNHRPGAATSGRESLLGAWEKLAQLGISRAFWKSGHMLNADLGGPPQNSNLIPIPQAVNRAQESEFDSRLRSQLYQPKKPIWMSFVVRRGHPNDPEQHFVTYFKVEAAEMAFRDGRYAAPSAGSLKFERSGGDLPYPAPRTSAVTLNGLIASGDQRRDSVRAVAAAVQLEATLVADLVARGTVLSSVADIETFIRSKSGDYGSVRVARYLANFQRVRSSITL